MISIETRKLILKIILVCVLHTVFTNAACDSNKQLYTEIGCKPIYDNNDGSCPVAYNCENVFARPANKCYFNGNVYELSARLSEADSALNPCLAACFCDQRQYNNETVTKFVCAQVECPSYFTRIADPCYFQYESDSCCEVRTYCPEEKSIIHECHHEGNVYKKGQRLYIGNHVKCICSETFNGTVNDQSCRQYGCSSEIHYMENILKRSAPIFYETADGCPIEWYHPDHDAAVVSNTTAAVPGTGRQACRYGDVSIPPGQNVTFDNTPADSDVYSTTCSCSVPPLVTCIKTRRDRRSVPAMADE